MGIGGYWSKSGAEAMTFSRLQPTRMRWRLALVRDTYRIPRPRTSIRPGESQAVTRLQLLQRAVSAIKRERVAHRCSNQ